jgi:hypothetical protein
MQSQAWIEGHYEPVETHNMKRMQARAKGYVLKYDNHFKLGVCAPLLKCITQEQGIQLVKEIHSGMCGSHIAARALAGKAFRQGFYCPMAIRDAEQIVKTCKACQFTAKHQRRGCGHKKQTWIDLGLVYTSLFLQWQRPSLVLLLMVSLEMGGNSVLER